jgi:hypothetical protein
MLAIPALVLLVACIYAHPQDVFHSLRAVPILYVLLGLSIFGGAVDLRLKTLELRSGPLLPWVLAFVGWSAFTVLLHAPGSAAAPIADLAIGATLYGLIAHCVPTFRALHWVAGAILVMVIFICFVGAHQGFAPKGCVEVVEAPSGETLSWTPDGRACETIRNCYDEGAEPGADYACEHVGLLGTTSVGGGRVRYLGVLQDPNELALAGAVGLPLAFALGAGRRKTPWRVAVWACVLVLVLLCAVLTESRGGQLVVLAVLAVYGYKRLGAKGLVLGALLAAPLLLLHERNGEEATSSTLQRLDCWASALSIARGHPLLGVGLGQFTEHATMTAHNAYLLALAELGVPGMVLFSIVLYLAAKIPFVVLRETGPAAAVAGAGVGGGGGGATWAGSIAHDWAVGLLAAFAGLAVGIFFLSFTYHYVLWIYVGLSGALFAAVRAHDPSLRVRFGLVDLLIVCAMDLAIVAGARLYTGWALR